VQVYDAPAFASLSGEVGDLFQAAGQRDFFSLPGWFDLVSRFGSRNAWESRLVVDNNAEAALVLQVNAKTGAIEGALTPYSCRYDAICRGDARAVQSLTREFTRADCFRHSLVLGGLDPEAPSFDAMLKGLEQGGTISKTFFCWGTWHEAVQGRSFDEYMAMRPSSLLNTHRRKFRSARSLITFEIVDSSDHGMVESFISVYNRIYQESWKGPEPFPRFIPELVRFAANCGALRAGTLRIDGEPAAGQFWIVWKRRALLFKLAFADKYRAYSPGTLLTMHMLQGIFEQDDPEILDLGRGDDAYKKLWVSARSERWGIEAANPRTMKGRIAAAGIALSGWKQRLASRALRQN
jgi:hypothetical protein